MRCLVVHAHPVEGSFSHSICHTAVTTLAANGHTVDALDLYADGFDPVLSRRGRVEYYDAGVNTRGVEDHVERLRLAEGVIFIYPTWWYGLPAILKGWLDRVWIPGVAFALPEGGRQLTPLLTNVRLLGGIATYGSPWWSIRWLGDPGRITIIRGIRPVCAPRCRTFWLGLYGMDNSTPARRAAFLGRIERHLTRI